MAPVKPMTTEDMPSTPTSTENPPTRPAQTPPPPKPSTDSGDKTPRE